MESSTTTTTFPKKPARSAGAQGKELKLFSNYFSIDFDSKDVQGVNKYTVKFEPEIPDNSRALRKEVLKKCRDKIKEHLEFYIDWGLCVFSLKKVAELPEFEAEHDTTKYRVKIEWVQVMEKTDKDHMNFLKIFFNSMMRSLKFEQIGPKTFNQAQAHALPAHNIRVWPGFDSRLIMKESGVLLNIDVCFKVVRTDTCLQYLNDLRKQAEARGQDGQEAVQQAVSGMTVVTRYNQKTYRIDRVDFAQSPSTTFDKNGTPTSYADYYKTRYNEAIKDMNQPLLINKDRRTGQEVSLIPELCQLTGLTDAMRANFNLMKDLAGIVHTNAEAKIKEIKHLMNCFKNNAKCVEKQKLWHLQFNENPQELKGFKYDAGNLLMGPGASGAPVSFDIEKNAREIDRKIQGKMFTQTELKTWGIFYGDRDAQIGNQFKSTMEECLKTCGYEGHEPNMVQVKPGAQASAWIKELKAKLNEGVQMVVLILPGQKGKCTLYDDVKRFLLEEYPIPSQVILTATIQRGKNLRSIISKVLIQMNAKVGGIPWAVDKLPLMTEPTMVCGMDVFHSTALGKKSVLALTASMNQSATTYWSTSVIQDEIGQEMAQNLQVSFHNALEAFKKNNGVPPSRVIFYRDGVGEGQVAGICVPEIDQIKAAIASCGLSSTCKLMYINCCKRVNTRIFAGDIGKFQNPLAGTVIDQTVTDRDTYEFYLVSVAARQGMSTPTRFTVLYDSIGESPDKIEHLTYKLCHTYYNVSGAIKEPSCIRYAHRLAALVGERGGKNKAPPVIHKDFEKRDPCLYFI